MDRRERMKDTAEVLRSFEDNLRANLWTALPGIVQSFNNAAMTCVVQPAVMVSVRTPSGTFVPTRLPLLLDVPVIFPSGGGFTLTFPIKVGDEGLVHFASRCIDSWWQSGGIQPQAELRFQDLSDGFIEVGIFSQPRVLPVVSADNVQLRNNEGDLYVEMTPDKRINLKAPVGVTIDTPLATFTGDVQIDGDLGVAGSTVGVGQGTFDDIPVSTHEHTDVQSGVSRSGGPVPP